jgi:hypothetical protein
MGLPMNDFPNLIAVMTESEHLYAVWRTLFDMQERIVEWTTASLLDPQENTVRCTYFVSHLLHNKIEFAAIEPSTDQRVSCWGKAESHSTCKIASL